MTEASLARALGFVGNRSLIAGPKGGAGFMGQGTGRTVVRVSTPTPAPPAALINPNTQPLSSGGSLGDYKLGSGGSYSGSGKIGGGYNISMINL